MFFYTVMLENKNKTDRNNYKTLVKTFLKNNIKDTKKPCFCNLNTTTTTNKGVFWRNIAPLFAKKSFLNLQENDEFVRIILNCSKLPAINHQTC